MGCWKNQDKIMELYEEGVERIEHNSDWIRCMKNIIHMKEAMRDTIMTNELHEKVLKSEQLVIEVDEHI